MSPRWLWLFLPLLSCATLASPGEGDRDLPSAGVGPFRKLETDEVLGVAPLVLSKAAARYREPAVLSLAPEGRGEMSVALYVVASNGIVRTAADDGRSFFGATLDVGHEPVRVLSPDQPWEGARVDGPSVLRVGAEIWLYYASEGGIGLARSVDGLTFKKETAPVFVADPLPAAPSVARFEDGTFRMMYGSGPNIAEAESTDGLHFTRRGIVLGPQFEAPPETLTPGEKQHFDTLRVADPVLLPRVSPAGRLHVRVLYTGYDGQGASAIGFAARYGNEGPLSRNLAPVYAVDKHEAAPALLSWNDKELLFVQQDAQGAGETPFPGIAAALAPATVKLGKPETFATAP